MKRVEDRPRRRRRITDGATGLRRLRERLGYSQEQVAQGINTSKSVISAHEKTPQSIDWGWAQRYARFYNVNPAQVMFGGEAPTIAVAGYVGAGAAMTPFDDYAKGAGIMRVRCPDTLNPSTTVAVQVRGDSMSPGIEDGWILYYSRDPEQPPTAIIGELCVVKLADGRMMVKHVRAGPQPGFYNLMSVNAPIIEGVRLEWASPVLAMLSPRQAEVDLSEMDTVDNEDDSLFNHVQDHIENKLGHHGGRLPPDQLRQVIETVYEVVKAGEERARAAEKTGGARRPSSSATKPKDAPPKRN